MPLNKETKEINSPYLGRFRVLSQAKKHFKLDMNGRSEIESVDGLKKAPFECDITYLDVADTPNFNLLQSPLHTPTPLSSSPSTLDSSPQKETLYKTKSGRTVHWPKKLSKTFHLTRLVCVYLLLFVLYTLCL